MREITTKYDGECRRCGKLLEVGQTVMYEKSMGIFCPGCEPWEVDDVRHFRALKAQKKVDRLESKADRLRRDSVGKMAEANRCRQDWAWVTQPGHIPGRQKAWDRYNKGLEMLQEADKAEAKAESLMKHKTIVNGDAERRRQAKRESLDLIIAKGSKVFDAVFGEGEVIGVYKKPYRIKFDRGFTYARDKSFVRPIK